MSDRIFHENHKRRLLTTLRYVDELVSQAVARLDAASTASSLSEYVPDAQPVQQKVAADYLDRLRGLIRGFLESHGISLPERRTSALWAACTACLFASVSVEELRGRNMRGYGELSAEADRDLEALVAGLSEVLRKLSGYLSQTPDQDVRARIDRLQQPNDEVGQLRELDRIVTAHGLVEFRGNLAMLVERLESTCCEIAIFGRVSSGKSSLLNFLLETNVLPVGVTPVTAVPIRIVHGAVPGALVRFAESKTAAIPVAEVALYAAEEHNPSNAKHVSGIQIELPALLLEHVTFVDTPGLGSLALSGAKEAAAYIPRCDLGVVLIDAAASLAPNDVVLVDTLHGCGASVMVLVTKADLLEAKDRERTVSYVRQELRRNLGVDVPVHPVSVKDSFTALCEQWRNDSLIPQLRDHRTLLNQSMQKKIAGLRNTVRVALEHRLKLGTSARSERPANWQRLEDELSAAVAALEAARFEAADLRAQIDTLAAGVLRDAAQCVVDRWRNANGQPHEDDDCLRAAYVECVNALSEMMIDRLRGLQTQLCSALAAAAKITGATPQELDWLPRISGLPIPEVPDGLQGAFIQRSLARFLGRQAEIGAVLRQLQGDASRGVIELLKDHAKRLDSWWQRSVEDLHGAFTVQADLYRAKSQPHLASWLGSGNVDYDTIENDLRLLDA